MKRITCSANYHAENCGDFCGLLPRVRVSIKKDGDCVGAHECLSRSACPDCLIFQAFKRLKEYEDTGYSPEEIFDLTKRGAVDG